MAGATPTKREALRLVERGHREVMRLIDELPSGALTRTGIGGGAWSPADLLGHLAAWEGLRSMPSTPGTGVSARPSTSRSTSVASTP